MDRPTYSTVDVYVTMRQCWQYHPAQRPTFTEILEDFNEMCEKTGDVSLPHYELPFNLFDIMLNVLLLPRHTLLSQVAIG